VCEKGRVRLDIHILSHDDEQFLPHALRYWSAMVELMILPRIIVHDGGPTGKSGEVAREFGSWIEVRPWDTAGQLNDDLARKLKNECWRGTDADFVAVMDADELLHFPAGVAYTLDTFKAMGAAIIKPHGFEMFSDEWIEPSPDKHQRITSLVKDGAPDDYWYAKSVLFAPRMVHDSGFGIGAHEARPVLRDGRILNVDRKWPFSDPPVYLLHYKSIFGGLERIAARYDATRKRLSAQNVRMGWGNTKEDGKTHALNKREMLLPYVRRVVA